MASTTTKFADELGLDDLFQRIDLTGFENNFVRQDEHRYLGYVQMIEGTHELSGEGPVVTVSLVTGDDVRRVHVQPHAEVTVARAETRTNIHFGGAS